MTMIDSSSERCSCCGMDVPCTAVVSTNENGPRDLDGRPAEMFRSTIEYWIRRCPKCGYCAASLDHDGDKVFNVVRSDHYQRLLADDPATPPGAIRFRCRAYLDLMLKRPLEEFRAWLHGAWVCDDARRGDAAAFRRAAATVGRKIVGRGGSLIEPPENDTPGLSESILADLLRRAGDFEAAVAMIDEAQAKATLPALRDRLDFMRLLVARRDDGAYTVADREPREPVAPLGVAPDASLGDLVDLMRRQHAQGNLRAGLDLLLRLCDPNLPGHRDDLGPLLNCVRLAVKLGVAPKLDDLQPSASTPQTPIDRYRLPLRADFPPMARFFVAASGSPLVLMPGQGWFDWSGGAPHPVLQDNRGYPDKEPADSFDQWRKQVEVTARRTIQILGPSEDDGSETAEVLFFGPDAARIELQPMFLEGLSAGEVWRVRLLETGEYQLVELLKKSALRVLRFVVPPEWAEGEAARSLYKRVAALGGRCDVAMGGVLTINLPDDCGPSIESEITAMVGISVPPEEAIRELPRSATGQSETSGVVTCACCGTDVAIAQWPARTLTDGIGDLDGRPGEPMRSTIGLWVRRCPECGYCARDLSKDCGDPVRELVRSPEYCSRLLGPRMHIGGLLPTKAIDFYCKAYLDSRIGPEAQAFWALVHAAWICDDAGHREGGNFFRDEAVRLGKLLLGSGKSFAATPFYGDPGDAEAILADLLRRKGDYRGAIRMAEAGLAKPAGDLTRSALEFQRLRAQEGDGGRYSVDYLDELPAARTEERTEWSLPAPGKAVEEEDKRASPAPAPGVQPRTGWDLARALFDRGRQAIAEGNLLRAEHALREAIEAYKPIDAGGDRYHTAINELGLVFKNSGRIKEASECYRTAHEHFLKRHGIGHGDTVTTMHNLGATLSELGDVELGGALLTRSLELMIEHDHPRTIDLANNYATLSDNVRARGDTRRAIEFLNKSIEICSSIEPPQPVKLAGWHLAISGYHRELGEMDRAVDHARQGIALRQAGLGHFDRETADACNELGVVLAAQGDHAGAEKAFRDALGRLSESANRGDLFVVNAHINLAETLRHLGRNDEAEEQAREAFDYGKGGLSDTHPKTLRAMGVLGDLMRLNGRAADALPLLTRARKLQREASGDPSVPYALSLNDMALALRDCGAAAEAIPLYREALDILGATTGPNRRDICFVRINLANALFDSGDPMEAGRLLAVIAGSSGATADEQADDDIVALANFRLAEMFASKPEGLENAWRHFQLALEIYDRVIGSGSWQSARCCDELSRIALAFGNLTPAWVYGERAYTIREERHGVDHPYTLTAFQNFLAVADRRDAHRALAVAQGGVFHAKQCPNLSDRACGVYLVALGERYARIEKPVNDQAVQWLDAGLKAYCRMWDIDPYPALQTVDSFVDACMADGQHDLLVNAVRWILSRCESTPAVPESWSAHLRVHIVRALLFTGRAKEARPDAQLAWAYYHRLTGNDSIDLSAPWAHLCMTADPTGRNGRVPSWRSLFLPGAPSGRRFLRIRFLPGGARAIDQLLLEFNLLAPADLDLVNVPLVRESWLLEPAGETPRALVSLAHLVETVGPEGSKQRSLDPSQEVAGIEISHAETAFYFDPGTRGDFLAFQDQIVDALMRFEAVEAVGWEAGIVRGKTNTIAASGFDARDYYNALTATRK